MAQPNEDIQAVISKVAGMAGGTDTPDEPLEAADGGVSATTDTRNPLPLVVEDMPEADMKAWWGRIERAEQRREQQEKMWDILMDEYMPVVSKSGTAETVKVQAHFRNVHSKIGSLFYRQPDLVLQPDDPGPGNNTIPNPMAAQMPPGAPPPPPLAMSDIVAIKQAVLKKVMGRDGLKAARLMQEMLFDTLAWSGIGVCKVGYKATMKTVQKPVMGPDPTFNSQAAPPSMLGLQAPPQAPQVPQMGPDGQPQMQPEQVCIHDDWYARRFSPKKYLVNDDLISTRYEEDSTWQGMDFFITQEQAKTIYELTDDDMKGIEEDDRRHKYTSDVTRSGAPKLIHCIEIWAKSSIFTKTQLHPQAYHQLVVIKGLKTKPVVWRPSPDQDFDEEGKLTPDSLVGNPIKVLSIRDLADSCFPPSDSAFTNSEIKQLSTYRRQTIRIRDAATGKYLYDASAFGDEEVEALKNGDIGDFIAVEEGKLSDGVDRIFAQTSKIQGSADDQRGYMAIKQDMSETLGIGANQAGTETETVRTATEADKVASAIQARNDQELSRVVDIYLDIARAVDQLLMRYADQDFYVSVGGDDAAQKMQMWNGKLVTGKFLYDIAPDSQLRPDSASDYRKLLQYYSLTAKDPLSNRPYILKRLARMQGLDPAKAVLPPPPPAPPKPDAPKITLSLTAMDLSDPNVIAFVEKYAGALAAGPPPQGIPPHGGPLEPAEALSQHLHSNSGGRPNAPGAENHRATEVK